MDENKTLHLSPAFICYVFSKRPSQCDAPLMASDIWFAWILTSCLWRDFKEQKNIDGGGGLCKYYKT